MMGLFMAIVCFHEAIVDPTSTDRLTDFGFETRANMAIGCVLGIWLVIHAYRKK
jgi:hypothetical protein